MREVGVHRSMIHGRTMSRSGYNEDCDYNWSLICYRGAVASSIRGKRGQAFLREMLIALEALPNKELCAHDLEKDGAVCALGAVGKARGYIMTDLDPEAIEHVAKVFDIPVPLAREIVYENDEEYYFSSEASFQPSFHRWQRMLNWVKKNIDPKSDPNIVWADESEQAAG